VSGCADRGFHFSVQTILCRDCKELYDAVTWLKIPAEIKSKPLFGLQHQRFHRQGHVADAPPAFDSVLNRLLFAGARKLHWLQFKIRCPVSPAHRVRIWNEPDKCPRCGFPLERNTMPFRIWE
jgi:hypothetical protein